MAREKAIGLGPGFRRQSGFDKSQSSPNLTTNGESTVRRNSWMTGLQLFLSIAALVACGNLARAQGAAPVTESTTETAKAASEEFVSGKIPGETASLTNPAVDRILDSAAEVGLLIHNDVDVPFPKEGAEPAYLSQMRTLLKRHIGGPIIWAHCGVGRIVRPVKQHGAMLESILNDPAMKNVYFDISWDEVAKYIVASPESVRVVADIVNRNPDRFLVRHRRSGTGNSREVPEDLFPISGAMGAVDT